MKTKPLTIRLPADLDKWLTDRKAFTGSPKNHVIIEALREKKAREDKAHGRK